MDKGKKLLLLLLPCCVALALLGMGLLREPGEYNRGSDLTETPGQEDGADMDAWWTEDPKQEETVDSDATYGQEPGLAQGDSPDSFFEPAVQSEQKGFTGAVDPDFRADTGESSRRMVPVLEYNGRLYFTDKSKLGIYCCNLDGSDNRLFLEVGEDRALSNFFLVSAGQNIGVGFQDRDDTESYYLELYTESGESAGRVPVHDLYNVIYDDGYFYYLKRARMGGGTLYRIREDGTGEEALLEAKVQRGVFRIHDEYIYYLEQNEGDELMRMHKDGTGKENIGEQMGLEAQGGLRELVIKGVFYKDHIYYIDKRKEEGEIVQLGMDGSREIVASSENSIFTSNGKLYQTGNLFAFYRVDEPESDAINTYIYNMDTGAITLFFRGTGSKTGEDYTEEYNEPFMVGDATRIYYSWYVSHYSWSEKSFDERKHYLCSMSPTEGRLVRYNEDINYNIGE